ncbi:MAG: acetate kinase [Defluviitaleaceae bacterium]|nr:acetate kinase [Defluviitaleaceae bacterium]
MKILVLNCGSSSLKYQLIDMEMERALAKGMVECIGIRGSRLVHEKEDAPKVVLEQDVPTYQEAVQMTIDALVDANHGAIKDIKEISAVGHRVVHGGENFAGAVVINQEVKKAIEECYVLAPLHNPANLVGINACEEILDVPQVAVFDTAFHQTMPEKAFMYALPYDIYNKHKLRRYGFHGTSHGYVAGRAAAVLGKDIKSLKLISCHLGNGASICAIENGQSIDTSMGLTPLEGLIMGTRVGDVDPAAITFIMKKEGLTAEQIEDMMNKSSGVFGISGLSSDFRHLIDASTEGDAKAKLAIDMYCYRIAKYIGAYAAALKGVDAIIFTAGVGENASIIRKEVCMYLGFLGVEIDDDKNSQRGVEVIISTTSAKTPVVVIPTNEELAIARETFALTRTCSH